MMRLDKAYKLIDRYYPKGSDRRHYFLTHSETVMSSALLVAKHNPQLEIDLERLQLSALLHDIGICLTDTKFIGCFGDAPYIMHGVLGCELLSENGFEDIALVCERHVGVGLSCDEIIADNLPLPHRDMLPITHEERIVCYADKFYSKSETDLTRPKKLDAIIRGLERYSYAQQQRFITMKNQFGYEYIYEKA